MVLASYAQQDDVCCDTSRTLKLYELLYDTRLYIGRRTSDWSSGKAESSAEWPRGRTKGQEAAVAALGIDTGCGKRFLGTPAATQRSRALDVPDLHELGRPVRHVGHVISLQATKVAGNEYVEYGE